MPTLIGNALEQLPEASCTSAVDAALEAGLEAIDIYPAIDIKVATKLQGSASPELVMALYNRIPKESVALQKTGIEIYKQAAQIMLNRNTAERYPEGYIDLLNNYTSRLLLARQVDDAKTNVDITFDLVSKHYAEEPQRFFMYYVNTLESRAVICSYQGDKMLAIEDRERVIEMLDNHNHSLQRKLATTLNNQAGVLFSAERWDEALRIGEDAVKIYQVIYAETKPELGTQFNQGLQPWVDDCRPELGYALIALSTYQNKMGDTKATDLSSGEALNIFKTLNADFPDQFSHHLAQAYNNRAMSYSSKGLYEKVVESLGSSAKIYTSLAKNHLSTYAAEYILVLKNLVKAKLKNNDQQGAQITYQVLGAVQQKLSTGAK